MSITMSHDELSIRVAALEATEAVRVVVARYCAAVDDGDLVALAALFDPDAVLHGRSPQRGRDAVVAYYARVVDSGRSLARHHVTNQEIAITSPTQANHDARFLALFGHAGRAYLGFGVYRDVLALCDGSWRFTEKTNDMHGVAEVEATWGRPPLPDHGPWSVPAT
jgi:uncharacterized protein (TIGR02246 family)